MQLLLPLDKAVCCAAANGITVDGDVSVALGDWFAAALVHTHHVFDTVHALHPVQIVVLQKLVALNRVHHSTRNTPLVGLLVEGHSASCLYPVTALVLHVIAVTGLIYCTPVKLRHVGCKQLGFAMHGLRRLINGSHFFHLAAAVILNDMVFLATPFTKHIDCACNEL